MIGGGFEDKSSKNKMHPSSNLHSLSHIDKHNENSKLGLNDTN
jgi:hypothetical protein